MKRNDTVLRFLKHPVNESNLPVHKMKMAPVRTPRLESRHAAARSAADLPGRLGQSAWDGLSALIETLAEDPRISAIGLPRLTTAVNLQSRRTGLIPTGNAEEVHGYLGL